MYYREFTSKSRKIFFFFNLKVLVNTFTRYSWLHTHSRLTTFEYEIPEELYDVVEAMR